MPEFETNVRQREGAVRGDKRETCRFRAWLCLPTRSLHVFRSSTFNARVFRSFCCSVCASCSETSKATSSSLSCFLIEWFFARAKAVTHFCRSTSDRACRQMNNSTFSPLAKMAKKLKFYLRENLSFLLKFRPPKAECAAVGVLACCCIRIGRLSLNDIFKSRR